MQLHFVGKNIDVTDALKQFTTEKFNHLTKYDANISNVNIVFHIEHVTHIVEATLHLPGIELHATAKDDDMYKAIDALIDKLAGQLIKHKEKLIDSHR